MKFLGKIQNARLRDFYRILFVVILSALATYLVFITGGTKTAWPQLYFVIILLAAYYWKIVGGVITALILGILSGPLMPLDVDLATMQTPINWIIRMLMYTSVGFLMGYILEKNNHLTLRMTQKDLTSQFTGLYNTNKLFPDLNMMIRNHERFCLVFFDIRNLGEISKYVDYGILGDIIQKVISGIKLTHEKSDLYSSDYNEYILVLKECDEQNLGKVVFNNLENILTSVGIDHYAFHLVIKAGIVFSGDPADEAIDLFNKARIASNQGEEYESSVHIYDPDFDSERRLFHEISGSIKDAINNGEFYLVYHPIISLTDKAVTNVEVLVRWDRGERQPIGPGTFIKIAEQTGLAPNITKEIVRQHIKQILLWEQQGLFIKSSVNITANELLDKSHVNWIKDFIDAHHPDRSLLGIEITERVVANKGDKLNEVLSYLRSKGYVISIDDFGTGYNTLTDLIELKADVIKIDKYFIDRIDETHIRTLIKYVIELVHEMGIQVIAEGVETKEQLMTLKQLSCDEVQGFYFSKPLLPDDFLRYYASFDMLKYF